MSQSNNSIAHNSTATGSAVQAKSHQTERSCPGYALQGSVLDLLKGIWRRRIKAKV